jgi:mannose/fructose/N-acetylgalactosamine-specific phosphotransferase system component IID
MLAGLSFKIRYVQTIAGQTVEGEGFDLQKLLDSLLPYLLPIALVAFCYWMLKNRRLTPVKVIGIIAVITFVLGFAGLL